MEVSTKWVTTLWSWDNWCGVRAIVFLVWYLFSIPCWMNGNIKRHHHLIKFQSLAWEVIAIPIVIPLLHVCMPVLRPNKLHKKDLNIATLILLKMFLFVVIYITEHNKLSLYKIPKEQKHTTTTLLPFTLHTLHAYTNVEMIWTQNTYNSYIAVKLANRIQYTINEILSCLNWYEGLALLFRW